MFGIPLLLRCVVPASKDVIEAEARGAGERSRGDDTKGPNLEL
jgi:hypothetical protein